MTASSATIWRSSGQRRGLAREVRRVIASMAIVAGVTGLVPTMRGGGWPKAHGAEAADQTGSRPSREAPSTADVIRSTQVAAGHEFELVASEPAVVDPVAVTFDESGRPYVVEYRDYPSGPPAGSPPLSRVVRLDDGDGDGHYESSTPVAEHLPFSQGILAIRGGLLVTASPDLLLLSDSDGDGSYDRRETLATGFRVGNPQLRAACPAIGPDNAVWITGGLSGGKVRHPSALEDDGVSIDRRDVRIDLARGTIRPATGFGQFGNAFDARGHRFTASNRNPLMVSLLPPEALARNPLVDLGPGYADAAPSGADSRVAAVAATNATAISHTGTHTSACGLTIFHGDLLGPEADGDAFTCEPVSHAVVRRRPAPLGAGFTSTHPEPLATEFVASAQTWFRPVFTTTAPDGSLWIVDFCRASVEHPDYMPPGVAATIDHRVGDHAGRIWRVRRSGPAPRPWSPPVTAAAAVALFDDPNGWRRDTAQRLLVEGRFPRDQTEAALRGRLDDPACAPRATIHALRSLDGLSLLRTADVERAAGSDDAAVREEGLRLAREADGLIAAGIPLDADERLGLVDAVASRSVDDADGQVRLAAILGIAGSPSPAATTALMTAAASPRLDEWTARGIVSGAVGRSAMMLKQVATETMPLPTPTRLWLVEKLATTTTADGQAGDSRAVLELLVDRQRAGILDWFDVAVLAGLTPRRPMATLLADPATFGAIAAIVGRAGELAAEVDGQSDVRLLGIRLLGAAAGGEGDLAVEARGRLAALVGAREPEGIQREAVRALVSSGDEERIRAVIDAAAQLEPAVRAAAVSALLDRPPSLPLLLSAIEQGALPAGVVALERRKPLLDSADTAVREAAARIWGAGSTALDPVELADLTASVRRGGDGTKGREVFIRHCANCHRAGVVTAPVGHAIGPDLAEAADRPIERLLADIVDPNRAVEPRYEATVVVTDDGTVHDGILQSSGADAVTLARAGGERELIARDRIESIRGTGRSLMPEGFGRAVPHADFADLLEFLRGGRPVGPPQ